MSFGGIDPTKRKRLSEANSQPQPSTSGQTDSKHDSEKAVSAEQIAALSAAVLQMDSEEQKESKPKASTSADATNMDEASGASRPSLHRKSQQGLYDSSKAQSLLEKLHQPKPLSLRG